MELVVSIVKFDFSNPMYTPNLLVDASPMWMSDAPLSPSAGANPIKVRPAPLTKIVAVPSALLLANSSLLASVDFSVRVYFSVSELDLILNALPLRSNVFNSSVTFFVSVTSLLSCNVTTPSIAAGNPRLSGVTTVLVWSSPATADGTTASTTRVTASTASTAKSFLEPSSLPAWLIFVFMSIPPGFRPDF